MLHSIEICSAVGEFLVIRIRDEYDKCLLLLDFRVVVLVTTVMANIMPMYNADV